MSTKEEQEKKPRQQRRRQKNQQKKTQGKKVFVNKNQAVVVESQKKKYGTQGRDPRSLASQEGVPQGFTLQNATSFIDYKPIVAAQTVQGVLIPFFTQLCERGLFTNNEDPSVPYWAYCYLFSALTSAFQSTTPMITRLPMGMKVLFDAVSPVETSFKAGQASYTWDTTDTGFVNVPNYIFPVGGLSYNMGIPASDNFVNMFPVLNAPTSYTVTAGQTAWTVVLAFLESLGKRTNNVMPMTKVVDAVSATETEFKDDVSAFAACYAERGDSAVNVESVGCITTELFLTHKIQAPVFAKFAPWNQVVQGYSESHQFGGTVASLGAQLMTFTSMSAIKNKFKPIMKPIDGYDCYNFLSLILANAIQLSQQQELEFPIQSCPLTPQEVYILLRTIYASYPTASWGLDYIINDQTQFQPYIFPFSSAQANNYAIQIVLPQVFVENLRALVMTKMAAPPRNFKGKIKEERTELKWIPVFGQWNDPSINLYENWQINNVTLYTTEPSEVYIRVLDGYVPSTMQYVQLVGNQLDNMITSWNAWIANLTPYVQTAKFSLEGGNSAFNSLIYTRYCFNSNVAPTLQPTKAITRALGEKRESLEARPKLLGTQNRLKRMLGVTPINNPGIIINTLTISANQNFIDTLHAITGAWVLPKILVYDMNAEISGWSMSFYEPYQIKNLQSYIPTFPVGTSVYQDLNQVFAQAASGIVHQVMGKSAEQWDLLYKVAEQGNASVFTQTVADLAANITGIPMLSNLGSIFGSLLPF